MEVLSQDDRWSEVMHKLGEYFEAGVLSVWVVDLKTRRMKSDLMLVNREALLAELRRVFDAQTAETFAPYTPASHLPLSRSQGRKRTRKKLSC